MIYLNMAYANGVTLTNDPMDEKAKATLKELYPDREIIGVPAREILLGGGNIHCITQQVPKK